MKGDFSFINLYEAITANWNNNVKSKKELINYMENFQLIYSYNSGKMENPEITFDDTREIFENGKVISYTGNLKTLYEIKNLKDCIDLMIEEISNKKPINIELIKDFHRTLTKYTYDERRFIDNEVAQELKELIDEISVSFTIEKVLTAGAYFHLKFENIHPFADGNGRTGRALLNYFLMFNGHPPICIYDEDKKEYINALRQYDTSGDIEPMTQFLKGQTEKTWQKTRSLTKLH